MDMLIKSLIISLACVGLRIVSSPGMILYFLRMPYEWAQNESDMLTYILKPVIGCVTCMASVWTLVIEKVFYSGLNKATILIIFIVAALNSIIYGIYQKIVS